MQVRAVPPIPAPWKVTEKISGCAADYTRAGRPAAAPEKSYTAQSVNRT